MSASGIFLLPHTLCPQIKVETSQKSGWVSFLPVDRDLSATSCRTGGSLTERKAIYDSISQKLNHQQFYGQEPPGSGSRNPSRNVKQISVKADFALSRPHQNVLIQHHFDNLPGALKRICDKKCRNCAPGHTVRTDSALR
jgi:hypothetical protein